MTCGRGFLKQQHYLYLHFAEKAVIMKEYDGEKGKNAT